MELSPGARRWQVTGQGPPTPVPLPQLQGAVQKRALQVPGYLGFFSALQPKKKKENEKENQISW